MIKLCKVIKIKKIIILFSFMLLLLSGCGKKNPIVTMEFDGYGTITIELYPNIAPNTVANFVNLIEDGFYDNNTVHRIQKDFVVQGGDPTGTGMGGPGYTIKGEFSLNGVVNNLSHVKGIISMARSSDYNSAGSQFFIVLSDQAKYSLDKSYAAFGKVTSGFDVLEKMEEEAKTIDDMGTLEENITIKKATVNTYGQTYKVEKYS